MEANFKQPALQQKVHELTVVDVAVYGRDVQYLLHITDDHLGHWEPERGCAHGGFARREEVRHGGRSPQEPDRQDQQENALREQCAHRQPSAQASYLPAACGRFGE